jgi:competence protein ComEA
MACFFQTDSARFTCLVAWVSLALVTSLDRASAAEELRTFHGCKLIRETWADGDSFPVLFPDGKTRSVRLYGVDCLETSAGSSDANARRMIDQRRWFGIPTIEAVQELGLRGKRETETFLARPFTVHTSFSDARGDPRYPRVYGFVTSAEGRDLSEHLVSIGLARAFGVVRAKADGTRGEEWRQQLADLELRASKKSLGAWALTDWERLPQERLAARKDEAEVAQAKGGKVASAKSLKPLDPNSASRDDLMALPGIGEVMALRIIEGRPYSSAKDLLRVPGIGQKTLEKLWPYLTFSQKKG